MNKATAPVAAVQVTAELPGAIAKFNIFDHADRSSGRDNDQIQAGLRKIAATRCFQQRTIASRENGGGAVGSSSATLIRSLTLPPLRSLPGEYHQVTIFSR